MFNIRKTQSTEVGTLKNSDVKKSVLHGIFLLLLHQLYSNIVKNYDRTSKTPDNKYFKWTFYRKLDHGYYYLKINQLA